MVWVGKGLEFVQYNWVSDEKSSSSLPIYTKLSRFINSFYAHVTNVDNYQLDCLVIDYSLHAREDVGSNPVVSSTLFLS